jgi:hypothetical protein
MYFDRKSFTISHFNEGVKDGYGKYYEEDLQKNWILRTAG